jgi:hypothetical protein
MRFYEFSGTDSGLDKFIILLRNEIGNYSKKRARASLNWATVSELAKRSGFEFLSDPKNGYETFKSIYDNNPAVQDMVKDFNDRGIELKVPGAPDEEKKGSGTQDSQAAVDQMAAAAAPQQLAAQA